MSLSRDRRGQSVVVGTVILFGFFILALSLYQVQIVPQENAQVEFEHFQEVRNDMVDLRAGVLQAGSTDRRQYQTVQLGTAYPPRLFAINPPAPSGTLRTTESYPITISNGTPEGTVTVPTRFIQYRPGYHEIEESPTWYDASVLYLDASDEGGGIAVIEDQNLVSDGEVQIVAVQNEFRRSGTGQVTLELYPADNVTETIPTGDLTVTVPTRLSDEYWSGTDIPSDTYSITSDANGDGIHNLTLETTKQNLTVETVGVQKAPDDVGSVSTASESDTGPDSQDGPFFESFIVETENQGSGNSDNIVSVSASGRVENANPDGTVRLRLIDSGGTNSDSVTMNPLFDVTTETSGNVKQVDVELTLLDQNDQPIGSCTYTGLTMSASPVTKSDFDC